MGFAPNADNQSKAGHWMHYLGATRECWHPACYEKLDAQQEAPAAQAPTAELDDFNPFAQVEPEAQPTSADRLITMRDAATGAINHTVNLDTGESHTRPTGMR